MTTITKTVSIPVTEDFLPDMTVSRSLRNFPFVVTPGEQVQIKSSCMLVRATVIEEDERGNTIFVVC